MANLVALEQSRLAAHPTAPPSSIVDESYVWARYSVELEQQIAALNHLVSRLSDETTKLQPETLQRAKACADEAVVAEVARYLTELEQRIYIASVCLIR